MRLRSTLSWLDRRMRTAVSTMRVSRCIPTVCCAFKWSLLVVTVLFFSPSVLSSCCSLCQAHHVCVRTPTITHVQTPWCRDIHSLFPVPPKEAEEQKRTMRYQFLNPSIFFFFFVKWCCFIFFSPFLQHF